MITQETVVNLHSGSPENSQRQMMASSGTDKQCILWQLSMQISKYVVIYVCL